MMGYRHKSIYQKYLYNKIKYVLLMIWKIWDDKFVIIKNINTSLNSEYALVKLTYGVCWTYWWYGETELWGLIKLICAMVKLTDVTCWCGWCEVNFNRVWNGVFWWTGIGSADGGDVIWWWWVEIIDMI